MPVRALARPPKISAKDDISPRRNWLRVSRNLTVMSKEPTGSRPDYIAALALSRIHAENQARFHPYPKRDSPKPTLIPDLRFEPTYLAKLEVADPGWQSVVWVTVRDQVLSPLIQGALWCVACCIPGPD
jgi:hypothetical protein